MPRSRCLKPQHNRGQSEMAAKSTVGAVCRAGLRDWPATSVLSRHSPGLLCLRPPVEEVLPGRQYALEWHCRFVAALLTVWHLIFFAQHLLLRRVFHRQIQRNRCYEFIDDRPRANANRLDRYRRDGGQHVRSSDGRRFLSDRVQSHEIEGSAVAGQRRWMGRFSESRGTEFRRHLFDCRLSS